MTYPQTEAERRLWISQIIREQFERIETPEGLVWKERKRPVCHCQCGHEHECKE